MDLEPALKQAVRRICQALHDYARERGWTFAEGADWSSGDYYLEVVVDVDMPRFYVTFVAKGFEGQDGHGRFESVQNHLRAELAKNPSLIRSINLVVKDHRQYRDEGSFPPGLAYEPVDEDFIRLYIPHKRVG